MKTSRRLSWWLASLNLLVSLGTAGAYTVTTTADTGAGSLRQGISATPSGGSIDFNIPTN
ncbi:MAG: hypothetical protein ACJ8KX_08930 [Chthoniobacterales bacterium]